MHSLISTGVEKGGWCSFRGDEGFPFQIIEIINLTKFSVYLLFGATLNIFLVVCSMFSFMHVCPSLNCSMRPFNVVLFHTNNSFSLLRQLSITAALIQAILIV